MTSRNSASDKLCFSPRQCREKSKTSHSSLSFGPCWSTLDEPVQPTLTCSRSSNMSSKRPKWSICWNVCRKHHHPSSCLVTIKMKSMVRFILVLQCSLVNTRYQTSKNTSFSKVLKPLPFMVPKVSLRLLDSPFYSNIASSTRGTSIRYQIVQIWCKGCHGGFGRCIQRARF